jgi:hypothetical protein
MVRDPRIGGAVGQAQLAGQQIHPCPRGEGIQLQGAGFQIGQGVPRSDHRLATSGQQRPDPGGGGGVISTTTSTGLPSLA